MKRPGSIRMRKAQRLEQRQQTRRIFLGRENVLTAFLAPPQHRRWPKPVVNDAHAAADAEELNTVALL